MDHLHRALARAATAALALIFTSACQSNDAASELPTQADEASPATSQPLRAAERTAETEPREPPGPQPAVFDDDHAAWVGEWTTSSRMLETSCPKWPMGEGAGTTRVIRHSETVFEVRRMNGWSGLGRTDGDDLTAQKSWTDGEGAPMAITLDVHFENDKRFVMTTELVVAPWAGLPKGCAIRLEEIGTRS